MRGVPALAPKQQRTGIGSSACASIRSSDAGEGSDSYPALPTRSRCRVRGPVSTPVPATNNRVYLEYPADMRSLGLDEGGGIKRIIWVIGPTRAIACLLGGRAAARRRMRQVSVAECGGGAVQWGHVKALLQACSAVRDCVPAHCSCGGDPSPMFPPSLRPESLTRSCQNSIHSSDACLGENAWGCTT